MKYKHLVSFFKTLTSFPKSQLHSVQLLNLLHEMAETEKLKVFFSLSKELT